MANIPIEPKLFSVRKDRIEINDRVYVRFAGKDSFEATVLAMPGDEWVMRMTETDQIVYIRNYWYIVLVKKGGFDAGIE